MSRLSVARSDTDAWLVPLLATALMATVFMAPGASDPTTRSTMVFVLTPMLSMSGVFARTRGYLHARERTNLISLPIAAHEHLRGAVFANLRGLAYVAALGMIAVTGSAWAQGLGMRLIARQAVECALLWICAAGLEPLVFAMGTDLGRNFAEDDPRAVLQRQISGGWTAPQSAVHLYTPAASVLGAAALAMVPQLAAGALFDGQSLSAPGVALAIAFPLGVLIASALGTRPSYARGFFEAVPWLMQSVRTLAGPPVPESPPPWLAVIKDPLRRLLLLQWLRLTPVPRLRALMLLCWIVWALLRPSPLSAPAIAVGVCLTMIWHVPNRALSRESKQRQRTLGALPLPPAAMHGREPLLSALAWAPAIAVVLIVARQWQ